MAVVEPTTSEVIGVFRSADAQGSGLINEGALRRVLVNLKCQQHDLDVVFSAAKDYIKDGKIRYEEFLDWLFNQCADHATETQMTKGSVLSPAEMDRVLQNLEPYMLDLLNSTEFADDCKKCFADRDANKNSSLDGEELIEAVRLVVPEEYLSSLKLTGDSMSRLILSFDADGNGKVEPKEFHRFCKWIIAMHVQDGFIVPLPQVKADQVGGLLNKLTTEEQQLLSADTFVSDCERFFREQDKDATGALGGENLVAAIGLALPKKLQEHTDVSLDRIRRQARMYNGNTDGKVELKDFANFCKWLVATSAV